MMFLGIDLGTTNVKALAVDARGTIAAQGSAPVNRTTTPDGGVEQDIDQIWEATCQAIREAVGQVSSEKIRAIGISSQGGALQLLGAGGEPLGPVISWLDSRGRRFDRDFEQRMGEEYLVAHTGHNLSSMTVGQLLRLREESPEMLEAAAGVGFVGDLIVGRLCGRRAHDPTSLSIGMLYNPRLGSADPQLLELLKIDDKRLPELVSADAPAGGLLPEAAERTGLVAGIPVSPAIHDQYAASVGAGAVNEGDVLVGTGTAWVLLATTARLMPPIAPRTFVCSHPFEGLYGQMLSMSNGGSAVQWVLEVTGQAPLRGDGLDERLASVAPGADGLRCWPLLLGGRRGAGDTPPGGIFSGITLGHSASHLLRAVVEGLACELARHLGWLCRGRAGESPGRVRPGGWQFGGPPDFGRRNRPGGSLPEPARHGASFRRGDDCPAACRASCRSRQLASAITPAQRTVRLGADAAVFRRLLAEYIAAFDRP